MVNEGFNGKQIGDILNIHPSNITRTLNGKRRYIDEYKLRCEVEGIEFEPKKGNETNVE